MSKLTLPNGKVIEVTTDQEGQATIRISHDGDKGFKVVEIDLTRAQVQELLGL